VKKLFMFTKLSKFFSMLFNRWIY